MKNRKITSKEINKIRDLAKKSIKKNEKTSVNSSNYSGSGSMAYTR
ncbi:MAG: hypothetical protein ACOYOK_01335 [Pseudobdellovibrionaceae bacterium]